MPFVTPFPIGTPLASSEAKGVEFTRNELVRQIPKYAKIADCIAGSEAVKSRRTTYLPMPNAYDQSDENVARYEAYVVRAVFYNVVARTLSGLLGQVFLSDPTIDVPDLLDPVVKDANGSGVDLVQLAQACETYVLALGRAGLLTDFPKTTGPTTRQQQLDGSIRPTIHLYSPDAIINWRTETIGGKVRYTLIVLREQHEKYDDGFTVEYEPQYRVLRLVDGLYTVEVWRKTTGNWATVPDEYSEPVDSKGVRLTEIPFTFVGSVDNSATVDDPPLGDMAEINLAHYRNSADYEESVYITGQSTPVITGLTTQWAKDILKDRIELGSRAAIMLPVGASAELLQMEERTAAFAAMEHKEKQMVALGAKLVESQSVQRTATEASQEEASEQSVLSTVTNNVSAAFRFALEWCAIFQGTTTIKKDAAEGDEKHVAFALNTDFDISAMSATEAGSVISAWVQDAISFKEMRDTLRQIGWATQTDVEALKAIKQAQMDQAAFDSQFNPEFANNGGGNGNADE